MKVVVVSFDRLPTAVLGCYGNDWIETPNFDAFAAESILLERCYAELVWDGASQPSWWTGHYCFPNAESEWPGFDLFEQFRSCGIKMRCIADADAIPDRKLMPPFDELQIVDSKERSIRERMEELTALAEEQLRELSNEDSWLLWLAIPGLSGTPDREFLDVYSEELEDLEISVEEAVEVVAALQGLPDPLHGLWELQAGLADVLTAAETSQVDVALGRLLAKLPETDTATVVTAAIGGQFIAVDADRRRLQQTDPSDSVDGEATETNGTMLVEFDSKSPHGQLCDQLFHVPCLVRMPDSRIGTRDQTIVQSVDLLPSLASLFEITDPIQCDGMSWHRPPGRELETRGVAVIGDRTGNRALRTDEYLFVSNTDASIRLHVKPDDVWDIHDESAQAPDDVLQLQRVLAEFERSLHGEAEPLPSDQSSSSPSI